MIEADAQTGVLQDLIAEIEKKNSWGKNELIILIAKLCARAIDRKATIQSKNIVLS